ncbi:MAG TPA: nuclear transport factor 2 family protein [Candidatus Sulfotelmatobacter sp.]
MKTAMNDPGIGIAEAEGSVATVLTALREGHIDNAVNQFSEEFAFNDYGIGLEFRDKARLAEFFGKARELYPDSFLKTNRAFVSGDHVITEWMLRVTVTEPFYAGLTRRVPISLPGVSVVRMHNGKISKWSDYYDGLTSRRTALASHFTDWIEL